MAEQQSGEFERAIDRLDTIVKELESGNIGLEKSVQLFKEGRELARRCEELLKAAQAAVDGTLEEAPRG